MDSKFYILLILPGANRKIIKVEFSRACLRFVLGVAAALLATLGVLTATYFRMLSKMSDYNQLRSERESLKAKVLDLSSVVDRTEEKLDSIQSLARDVAVSYTFAQRNGTDRPKRNVPLAAEFLPGVGTRFDTTFQAFSVLRTHMLAEPVDLVKALFVTEKDYLDLSPKPSLWPVRGYVTSHFGQRIDPFLGEGMFHAGMDISAPFSSPIIAPADGLIVFTGPRTGYGNTIIVSHGYGISTKLAHLSKIAVAIGWQVKRGQVVGYVGTSGRTTGPHLHYEVLVNEVPVNPARYLGPPKRRQVAQVIRTSPS